MSADEFATREWNAGKARTSESSTGTSVPAKSQARSPGKLQQSQSKPAEPRVPQKTAAEQIGLPDHSGWMRKKGENYPTWKMRYFVLKGTNLYYLKSETVRSHADISKGRLLTSGSVLQETRIKGHIRLPGYRVIMDGDVNPGRYGFKISHDSKPSHSFSSEDSKVVREWMKSIMKAIIERDWQGALWLTRSAPRRPADALCLL